MQKHRKQSNNKDATPGDILWLRKKPSNKTDSLAASSPDENIFDHPVMIWSVNTGDDVACVLILTSFGKKDLNVRHNKNRAIRAAHLPIHPSPAHPDTNELLFLEDDLQLQNKSYVKTKERYWVPISLVRFRYCDKKSGKKYKLRSDSFQKVVSAVDIGIPIRQTIAIEGSSGAILEALPGYDKRSLFVAPAVPHYGSFGGPSTTPHQPAQNLITAYSETQIRTLPQHPKPRHTNSSGYSPTYAHDLGSACWDVGERQRIAAQRRATLLASAPTSASRPNSPSCLAAFAFIVFMILFLTFFLIAYWIGKVRTCKKHYWHSCSLFGKESGLGWVNSGYQANS
ncbi:hypothetical protein ABVK25_004965 [Lepraria finkii]|uniref:Uncharacterized protein n=1 Tax=Lepraria finkii TaxID=1340010 RepID=A0ABR4BB50_9LECA